MKFTNKQSKRRSLYTIPSWASDYYEVVCEVTGRDGQRHEYQLKDHATLVQWLPMAFAFPFSPPFSVPIEVRKNIYRNLVQKMESDGVLAQR